MSLIMGDGNCVFEYRYKKHQKGNYTFKLIPLVWRPPMMLEVVIGSLHYEVGAGWAAVLGIVGRECPKGPTWVEGFINRNAAANYLLQIRGLKLLPGG